MKNSPNLFYFFWLLTILACSDAQNFDQAKDLEVITEATGPMVYLETTEDLINTSGGVSQNIDFNGFNVDLFADRVISGSIIFQLENSTSKQLDVRIDFLDEGGNTLDFELFSLNPAPPTVISDYEVFYGPPSGKSIDILKNTSSFQISILNNSGNTSVSSLPDPKLIFRSSASFKLRVLR